jgi:two-component system chemotaxis sensor kinase CheA
MDMGQYLDIFIEETKEHLQSLNQCLLEMEKNPDDTSLLNEVFRVAHTIKGMAGTMGFTRMARLTHDMEDILQALRNNDIKISSDLIDLLFKCLDALESYTTMVVDTGNEGIDDNEPLINALAKVLKGETGSVAPNDNTASGNNEVKDVPAKQAKMLELNVYDKNVINKAADMGNDVYQITIKLNHGCVLKSARAFIIFKTLENGSEIIKSVPSVQDIEDEKFEYEFTVLIITKDDQATLEKNLNSIAEIDEIIITLVQKRRDTKEVKNESADSVQMGTDNNALAGKSVNVQPDNSEHKTDSGMMKHKTGKTVRVDINRLDVLLNLVSELIIQKTRLEGIDGIERTPEYVETVEYLERITTNLHDAVMKVRMVPVETVFNRFPRMIRDISKELNKEVELVMSGEETELDRTVIDEIGDPLIHLLRNSVDHGIENAEKRAELGKSPVGRVDLKAYQDGNNVVIEVGDDGAGINIEKVKKKAIEKGFVSKDIADTLSKKDIVDFMFKPNFSTADKITDISGRGVGLDVVKTKIEALGGVVDVETELGKGSKFFIRLPLTLAIVQALLVMVGDEKYALQLSSIQKIMNITPEEIKLVQKQEVILYRNTVIPIVRLDEVLEVKKSEDNNTKQMTLVIVKKGDKLTGLVVDKILGQQEIVQKSLGKLLSGIKIITSATILGDGNVALILDVNTLAR